MESTEKYRVWYQVASNKWVTCGIHPTKDSALAWVAEALDDEDGNFVIQRMVTETVWSHTKK